MNPQKVVIPVKTGIQTSSLRKQGARKHKKLGSCFHRKPWIPASAGMTESTLFGLFPRSSKIRF
jgi:hypothetical protein